MYWTDWKDRLLAGSRIFGILLLAGVLLAACGDDDDDDDTGADLDTTPTIEMTSPAGGAGTETMPADSTATMADDMTGEATEPEGDMTETEDDASTTEEEDGSATAGDSEGTATEDMTDGTATEGMDDDGTATEDMDDGTATESDDDDGTATEDDDMTATEEDDDTDGTATADDSDATGTESDDEDGTATADDDAAGGDSAELGDTIELEGFSLTVESAEAFVGLPGVFEADTGNELIALTLTIENTGDADELSVLRALSSMHLEDGSGERYDVDLVATAILLFNQEGIGETQIQSGEEVTGKVGFQIPEDTEELTLVIEDDAGESTEIDLTDSF